MQTNLKKKFLTAILALTILTFLTSNVFASVTIPKRPIYFPFNNGATLTFSTSILPLTFLGNPQTVYRDTSNRWHFGTVWITSTNDMTITTWFSNNWLKFTVTSSGTQQIFNGSKPTAVYINGVAKSEADGWSYTGGTVTVTAATTSAYLSWALIPLTFEAHKSSAPSAAIVYGTGFNLYFPATTKLAFQHLDVSYEIELATVTLTVMSGTLNGTSGTLTMRQTGARLMFRSLNTSTIVLSSTNNETVFRINGRESNIATLTLGKSYTIEWGWHIKPFLPIMSIIGMIGACGFIGAPTIIVLKLKSQSDPMDKIKFSILMAVFWVFSIAFLLFWIMGGG